MRYSLPETQWRDATVRETSLEYRRWHLLRSLGAPLEPNDESLLRRFIDFAPPVDTVSPAPSTVTYESVFGYHPSHPWNLAAPGGHGPCLRQACRAEAAGASPARARRQRLPLDPATIAILRDEAEARADQAIEVTRDDFGLGPHGELIGPRHVSTCDGGPRLWDLHVTAGLAVARAVLPEATVFPTRTYYLFYGGDGHSLLHHDDEFHTINLIAHLHGGHTLWCYPQFGRASSADVEVLSAAPVDDRAAFEDALRRSGTPHRAASERLAVDSSGFDTLMGREVAHAIYPTDGPAVTAVMSYQAFVWKRSWA